MMKYIMKIFGLVIILLISACEHETLLTGEPDDPGDISEDKVRRDHGEPRKDGDHIYA